MSFDSDKLNRVLRGLPAARCYWVGFSGGLDSTVLLHALAQQQSLSARLQALHVNHHLNPQADVWQRHCQQICAALHVPLECRGVTVEPAKGQSLEAVAREQRYQVFRALIQEADMLLLAHHQDDQMETFLLQALRGAGQRGLAAMPMIASFEAGHLARPLLGFARDELQAWAEMQKLTWLDDPSNADSRFDRNYLRLEVLPVIRQRWPSAAATVARSARHCGEALELLAAVAEEDWGHCTEDQGRVLPVAALRKLGTARAKNLLRHWLEKLQLPLPPTHKLEQIIKEVLPARADRNPCVSWEGAEVRRYRGRLYGLFPLPVVPGGELRLTQGEQTALGAGMGTLRLVSAMEGGLRAAGCPAEGLRVCFRSGGEVCKPAGQAHHRPLKKWLQEFKVVPWMRERLPLLYIGDQLAGVGGLFVCAPFAAGTGEPGLRIEWLSHPALH
ncbi:MAG TPA: tRNA lysidine(34) synthetase TilS [Gammaproteobacteria bacterium]|nr:tRNA lysidine(34) synthetase TilS [Gammaproteobacteria bacterium]